MSKQRVEVSTRQFTNTHGRPPRGFGQWGFEVCDASATSRDTVAATIWITGKYGEAKRQAVADVKELWAEELATGNLFLNVQP